MFRQYQASVLLSYQYSNTSICISMNLSVLLVSVFPIFTYASCLVAAWYCTNCPRNQLSKETFCLSDGASLWSSTDSNVLRYFGICSAPMWNSTDSNLFRYFGICSAPQWSSTDSILLRYFGICRAPQCSSTDAYKELHCGALQMHLSSSYRSIITTWIKPNPNST